MIPDPMVATPIPDLDNPYRLKRWSIMNCAVFARLDVIANRKSLIIMYNILLPMFFCFFCIFFLGFGWLGGLCRCDWCWCVCAITSTCRAQTALLALATMKLTHSCFNVLKKSPYNLVSISARQGLRSWLVVSRHPVLS